MQLPHARGVGLRLGGQEIDRWDDAGRFPP